MSRCGNCGGNGHTRRACKNSGTKNDVAVDEVQLAEVSIVIIRNCRPETAARVETCLLEGKPPHWNVMIANGIEHGVRLAIAIGAGHVFFVEETASNKAALRPHVDRLHDSVPGIGVVAVWPARHEGEMDLGLAQTKVDRAFSTTSVFQETVTHWVSTWEKTFKSVVPSWKKPRPNGAVLRVVSP